MIERLSMAPLSPAIRRRLRWTIGGALGLAALSIIFGGLFTALISVAAGDVPADAGVGFWVVLLFQSSLIWGLGALPFGSALGFYAALIWRPTDADQES
jgi:hypothetical protein